MGIPAKPVGEISDQAKARFWASVAKTNDGCWLWIKDRLPSGYGIFRINGVKRRAHRVSMTIHEGKELNPNLQLDHECKNRACVNPDHLREVTHKVNAIENSEGFSAVNAAKTHCPRGHEYDERNTYRRGPNGHRRCRTCKNMLQRKTAAPLKEGQGK